MKEVKIPKTLDSPPRAAGMPLDSVLIGAVTWLLFFVFNATFIGIIVGLSSGLIYQRYKKRSIIRRVARVLYWYLPASINPIKQGVKGHERQLGIKREGNGKET